MRIRKYVEVLAVAVVKDTRVAEERGISNEKTPEHQVQGTLDNVPRRSS